jgi:hypothetical protein
MYCAGPEDWLRIFVSARPARPFARLPHQRERLFSPSRRAKASARTDNKQPCRKQRGCSFEKNWYCLQKIIPGIRRGE